MMNPTEESLDSDTDFRYRIVMPELMREILNSKLIRPHTYLVVELPFQV
jgi:hypothetical protein